MGELKHLPEGPSGTRHGGRRLKQPGCLEIKWCPEETVTLIYVRTEANRMKGKAADIPESQIALQSIYRNLGPK